MPKYRTRRAGRGQAPELGRAAREGPRARTGTGGLLPRPAPSLGATPAVGLLFVGAVLCNTGSLAVSWGSTHR